MVSRFPKYIPLKADPENTRLHSEVLDDMRRETASMAVGRKFFFTEKGYIGLGPGGAQPGDIVSIFLGGRVPFLIRKNIGEGFRFVGESYVHGIMDGLVLQDGYKDLLEDVLLL